jgi:hypothetical protein
LITFAKPRSTEFQVCIRKRIAQKVLTDIREGMISNSIDQQLRFHQLFWFGVILITAVVSGYLLAVNQLLIAMGAMGFFWLATLPYHSKLAIYLAVATFSSALIVPLFPGRPYLWEAAALLGWSGLIITISMRQYHPSSASVFRTHRWMLLGALGYCLVLLITMMYRGVGLRILGSDQMGGRFYFQQLTCMIFPFLFVMCRPGEKTITRLLVWQCLLTTTYLISDYVLSRAPDALFFLLQFFELSGDAVNFELRAANFGIRRFQSFYLVGSGFFFLLLIKYKLSDFFRGQGIYLVPTVLMILTLGMLSGHRYLSFIVLGVLLLGAYGERFFSLKNTVISTALVVFTLGLAYTTSDRLPLPTQRAISFLPGINIAAQAKIDAEGTLDIRRTLRKEGMKLAPQYFWIGRGFGLSSMDYSWQWDPTTITGHVNMGRFYNGFVGLMVNTGVFGATLMLVFLGAGTLLAWRILGLLRMHGCNDYFSRVCKLLASLWIANTFAFLFLHGDSELAMKTFSLQAGLLIVCHEHLTARLKTPMNGANEDPAFGR